uniref:Uncharacterized protein n=1 Tax=Timema cristinae TaxID=61476 RepID=A0A7R9CCE8_TIMCR|nr:unnamed protein product [Timema cristinae]
MNYDSSNVSTIIINDNDSNSLGARHIDTNNNTCTRTRINAKTTAGDRRKRRKRCGAVADRTSDGQLELTRLDDLSFHFLRPSYDGARCGRTTRTALGQPLFLWPRQTPDVMEQLHIERPERYFLPGEIRPLGGSCVSGINKSHGYIVPPSKLHPDQHVHSTRQSKRTFIDKLPVCTDTKKDTLKRRNSEICYNIYDRRCLPFCPKEDVRQLELKEAVLTQPIIEPPKQKHTFEYPSLQRTSKHVESNSYKSKNKCSPTIICDDVAPKHPTSLVMSCGDMERIGSPDTDPCGYRKDLNNLNLDTRIKNPRSLGHACQLEHKMCSCMESIHCERISLNFGTVADAYAIANTIKAKVELAVVLQNDLIVNDKRINNVLLFTQRRRRIGRLGSYI